MFRTPARRRGGAACICSGAICQIVLCFGAHAQTPDLTTPPPNPPPEEGFDLFRRVPTGFGIQAQFGTFFGNRKVPTSFTIPETLRTVPTHPDDGYPPGTQWTIPTASFTTDKPTISPQGFVSIAPQYTLWRFTARAGVRIIPGQDVPSEKPTAGAAIPEINQEGTSDRGYGESLVYYFLYWQSRNATRTRPFGELELRLNRFVSLIGGYGKTASTEGIALENGWDRYDAFQTHLTQHVITLEQDSGPLYGAIRFEVGGPFAGFRLGYTSTRSRLAFIYPGVVTSLPSGHNVRDGIFFALDLCWTQSKAGPRKRNH